MEIYKVKDYKALANDLAEKTGCDVKIQLIERDHTHYQLSKMGISLGVLCVNRGEVSFAPFENLDTAKNNQYINAKFLPMFDEFVSLLSVFKTMFTDPDTTAF